LIQIEKAIEHQHSVFKYNDYFIITTSVN